MRKRENKKKGKRKKETTYLHAKAHVVVAGEIDGVEDVTKDAELVFAGFVNTCGTTLVCCGIVVLADANFERTRRCTDSGVALTRAGAGSIHSRGVGRICRNVKIVGFGCDVTGTCDEIRRDASVGFVTKDVARHGVRIV